MRIEKLEVLHSYFKELVRLLTETENYIALDELNFKAYSVKYNWLYQSICSEIDVVLKELVYYIDPGRKRESITECREVITSKYPSISGMEVKYAGLRDSINPWESWKKGENPMWWKTYNNVKHHRIERDAENYVPYYKLANQENVLYSLAGLYVLEWYLLCEYELTESEKKDSVDFYAQRDEAIAEKNAKGQIAISLDCKKMSIVNFKGLKTFFAGYYNFDYDRMVEILACGR